MNPQKKVLVEAGGGAEQPEASRSTMALFPQYCEQGAPGNVSVLRLVAH